MTWPRGEASIECGSGTHVRSLGRDLAESLGTAAVMSAPVCTAIGSFRIEGAVDPERLAPENWTEHLFPPLRAVESLPRIELAAEEVAHVAAGRNIARRAAPHAGHGDVGDGNRRHRPPRPRPGA